MSHRIKQLLKIIDPDLIISTVTQESYHGRQTQVVHAKLSPEWQSCPNCHSKAMTADNQHILVKNGSKQVTVRLGTYHHLPLVMRLAKQRYFCRNCHSHYTAQTYFLSPHCSISKQVTFKIIDLLQEKLSLTCIAKLTQVSITTVIRVLKSLADYVPDRYHERLPEVLMVDEFRSHATIEDSMSFICADGQTGELVDIFPSRKLTDLKKSFLRYSLDVRHTVKFLVTDMNAPYIELTKKVFPNAKVIIDRFHIVRHLNDAFNQFRVREMKRLKAAGFTEEARKLKSHWKRLLKNRQSINVSEYKRWQGFRSHRYPLMTEGILIDRLLSYSEPLKKAYHAFHALADAFRRKEGTFFFELLTTLPADLDDTFRQKLQNLLPFKEGILNAMIYPYSNGKLEAKNTHTKTLKRISYGFKSFENMRLRIFMINGMIQIK